MQTVVLSYSGCSTCKKALKWLDEQGADCTVRPIVEKPPSLSELRQWIGKSGLPVRKWLNTSGQSYRAIGKEAVDAASDSELMKWLSEDGKLVKRPVIVHGDQVFVGFKPEQLEPVFGAKKAAKKKR